MSFEWEYEIVSDFDVDDDWIARSGVGEDPLGQRGVQRGA